MRDNVIFHYGHKGDKIEKALEWLGDKHANTAVWILRGDNLHDWCYEPAIWTFDRITLRDIFKIPDKIDAREASAEVLGRLLTIQNDFSIFAEGFIEHYTRR
jgi:hypothetical protein